MAAPSRPKLHVLGPDDPLPIRLPSAGGPHAFADLATWFEILDAWTDYLHVGRELEPETIEEYESYLYRFFRRAWREWRVLPHTLTERHIHLYFRDVVSPRSAKKNAVIKALRSHYRWGVSRGLYETNPSAEIRVRRRAPQPAYAHPTEDLARLLNAAGRRGVHRAWTLLLMAETGPRVESMANVRPEDVDLERGLIHFRVAKYDKPYSRELSPWARIACEELLKLREADTAYGRRARASGLLIGVGKATIGSWAHEGGVDCGFTAPKQLRAHTLRATFGSNVNERGGDPYDVQAAMNHGTVAESAPYVAGMNRRVGEIIRSGPVSKGKEHA